MEGSRSAKKGMDGWIEFYLTDHFMKSENLYPFSGSSVFLKIQTLSL